MPFVAITACAQSVTNWYIDVNVWELYDLQSDPTEMHNLYGQPGTEEITAELMDELERLQVLYDDPIRNTPEGKRPMASK